MDPVESKAKNTDTLQLLNVFPEELWSPILANIKDANDYLRLCGVSPLFKHLLSGKRVPLMLKAVVQILLERNQNPRFLANLADHRQVCQAWKVGLEGALHNLPYHYQFTEELFQLELDFFDQVFRRYSEIFEQLSDIPPFEKYYRISHSTTGANPFVTRAIEVHCLPLGEPETSQFFRSCLEMLRKYGHHVWYLSLEGDMACWPTAVEFSKFVKELLGTMPNLKVLRCQMINPFWICEPLEINFPVLKNLVFVENIGIPFPIFEAIINPQFSSKKLQQIGVTFNEDVYRRPARRTFESICQLPFPITKLRIDFRDAHLSWDVIFSGLESHLKDTLTNLHISMPRATFFEQDTQLRLPNLKKLSLHLWESVPMDFLLGVSQTLEEMNLKHRITMRATEFERIKKEERITKLYLAVQCRQLYKSNMWDLFPNLRKIALNGRRENDKSGLARTRDQWEKSQENEDEPMRGFQDLLGY